MNYFAFKLLSLQGIMSLKSKFQKPIHCKQQNTIKTQMNLSLKKGSNEKMQGFAPMVSRKLFQGSNIYDEQNQDKPKEIENTDLYHKYTYYKGKMIQNSDKKSHKNLKISPKESQFFAQDNNYKDFKSESSEDVRVVFSREEIPKKFFAKVNPSTVKTSKYFQEESLPIREQMKQVHQSKNSERLMKKQSKQSKGSLVLADNYQNIGFKKLSSDQSSPPLPSRRSRKQSSKIERQHIFSPIKQQILDSQGSSDHINVRSSRGSLDKSFIIKNKLDKFSMNIQQGMEKINQKVGDLERRYLSLDLYFQELKQFVSQRKNSHSENQSVSQAKTRQFKFLLSEQQNRLIQIKSENQRLQKQITQKRISEQNHIMKIEELQKKLQDYQYLQTSLQKTKKSKLQIQKKLHQHQSKILLIQKQKREIEAELQKHKYNRQMENSIAKQMNSSNFILSSTLFGTNQDIDYLKQQITKLQYENKQYDQILTNKQNEIADLSKIASESKMMMEKIKQLNKELEMQCEKIQRESAQKQIEATEKYCNLNGQIKKKMKQYDGFKDLIVNCLEQMYKKLPKKIRKIYEGEIINKNRTNKCEGLMKSINTAVEDYEQICISMYENLFKHYSISPIQLEKIGIEECIKKVKSEIDIRISQFQSLKSINIKYSTQLQQFKQQNHTLLQQLTIFKSHQQQFQLFLKKTRFQAKKNILPIDLQHKISTSSTHDLSKKKLQIQKLNRELKSATEEAHKKYLQYQSQLADLQIKQKQAQSRYNEQQNQKIQLSLKLNQKQANIKLLQKNLSQIKIQKDGLSFKITQLNNQAKKTNFQNSAKQTKYESETEALKKKIKKIRLQYQNLQRSLSSKISAKQKMINQLLQQKKKYTLQFKLQNEKIQFANFMKQTKELDIAKKIQIERESISIEQNKQFQDLRQKADKLEQQNLKLQAESKVINSAITIKDRQIQKLQLEIKKRQENIDNLDRDNKQKQLRKNQIYQQYKKVVIQLRQEKQQLQKKIQSQRQSKQKQTYKSNKQLESIQQQLKNIIKSRNEQALKCKELQLKLSQQKRQNEQLINLVNKRQYQIEQKDLQIQEQLSKQSQQLKKKYSVLERELIQRQQYFKKSEVLMQQLVNQSEQSKAEIKRQEEQILRLIKQKQQLAFKLSEDIDSRSQNMKMTMFSYENQKQILKQRLQATEAHLQSVKYELEVKNGIISELREKAAEKRQQSSIRSAKQQYSNQISECRQQIQNLNNKIDILEQQLEETKIILKDREEEMSIAKRQKIKYYNILNEKQQYIQELQEAVKIKVNQADQLKQIEEEYEQMKEQFQNNQIKLKQQIEQLNLNIVELQAKSIEAVNQLRRQIQVCKKEGQFARLELQRESRQNKLNTTEKEQLKKDNKLKETQLINLRLKFQEFKTQCLAINQNEQNESRDNYKIQQEQSYAKRQILFQFEIQTLQRNLQIKQTQICKLNNQFDKLAIAYETKEQEIQQLKQQYDKKISQYTSKIQDQKLHFRIFVQQKLQTQQQLSKENRILNQKKDQLESELQGVKRDIKIIEQEKKQLLYNVENQEIMIIQKTKNIEELSAKIQELNMQIGELEEALRLKNTQREESISKQLQNYDNQKVPIEPILQQKLRQIDEKDDEIKRLKIQQKKIIKNQQDAFDQTIQTYKRNLNVLQRQLNTYKQANISLTIKCQNIEKELKQFGQRRDSQKYIVSQSPNNLDFASVSFDLPERQNLLKQLLSESQLNRKLGIISNLIQYHFALSLQQDKVNQNNEQLFEICSGSNLQLPIDSGRNIGQQQVIRADYLRKFQAQIGQILIKKQESFQASFLNIHSNSAIQILDNIRYQITEYRNRMNESVLQQLQFINHYQTDFCQDVEQQILQFLVELYEISDKRTVPSEIIEKRQKKWTEQKEGIQIQHQRQSQNHKRQLKAITEQNQKLQKQLNNLNIQLELQESEVRDLIDKKQEQIEEQQKCFMNQSQILRKELAKETARADRNQCNYLTTKKAIEKLLQSLCDKNDQTQEIEDTFEHIEKICDEKDQKLRKNMEIFLQFYQQQREMKKQNKQKQDSQKKKKKFFGFN